MITSDSINTRLRNGAVELRGSMDASRYKDYMLGLMFYKFLSDKTLETFAITAGLTEKSEDELLDEYTAAYDSLGSELEDALQKILGYNVKPEYMYQKWMRDINTGNFEVQTVTDSLNNFERTINTAQNADDFKGLFSSSTLDLSDTALGSNLNERSKNIISLIKLFADLDMVELQKTDVLGDAYEYLIGMFAIDAGKKAGEFYTPRQVSEVLAQIVACSTEIKTIYDPAVGSGSLLLTVSDHLSKDARKDLEYFGQEKNTATYNLTRMNLLLHGVRPEKMTIRNNDTLANDWPEDPSKPDQGALFDAVVMNPPYSLKNWNNAGIKETDPRFEIAGVLPPSGKGDYAFLLHGLYHLNTNGTMAILLPHGVLFRGATEGIIRQRLIVKNRIDAVIGLPATLFVNTGIPVIVMVLKKNRSLDAPILFVDASKGFVKAGKFNKLEEKDIAKIVDVYKSREEIEGYSHLATMQELKENDYNMNIPRYVASLESEIAPDVDGLTLGGIPVSNIKSLKVLNELVPDVIESCTKEIRPGYVMLTCGCEEIKNKVYESPSVQSVDEKIASETKTYADKYWNELHKIDAGTNANAFVQDMLESMKLMLEKYDYVDEYDGYQTIANMCNASIKHDIEYISAQGFYAAARLREPNMVQKGSGKDKHSVQDGWKGSLIPNDLIAKEFFGDEQKKIEEKREAAQAADDKLSEYAESAKEEDTDENTALFDLLKKDENDEPLDSFDMKLLKNSLKEFSKGSTEYELVKKVIEISDNKAKMTKDVKNKEDELESAVEERITNLTNDEIDSLLYKKWFGSLVEDIRSTARKPIADEIKTLEMLEKRYDMTIDEIDAELEKETAAFDAMRSELVVTEDGE